MLASYRRWTEANLACGARIQDHVVGGPTLDRDKLESLAEAVGGMTVHLRAVYLHPEALSRSECAHTPNPRPLDERQPHSRRYFWDHQLRSLAAHGDGLIAEQWDAGAPKHFDDLRTI